MIEFITRVIKGVWSFIWTTLFMIVVLICMPQWVIEQRKLDKMRRNNAK